MACLGSVPNTTVSHSFPFADWNTAVGKFRKSWAAELAFPTLKHGSRAHMACSAHSVEGHFPLGGPETCPKQEFVPMPDLEPRVSIPECSFVFTWPLGFCGVMSTSLLSDAAFSKEFITLIPPKGWSQGAFPCRPCVS